MLTTLLGQADPQTFVGLDAEEDVEVAILAAAAPGIALAAHAQPAAVVHARRDAQVDLRQRTTRSVASNVLWAPAYAERPPCHPQLWPQGSQQFVTASEAALMHGQPARCKTLDSTRKSSQMLPQQHSKLLRSGGRGCTDGQGAAGAATDKAVLDITFLLFRTRPSPPHVLHGVLCCPVPLHWSHSATCQISDTNDPVWNKMSCTAMPYPQQRRRGRPLGRLLPTSEPEQRS